jgi:hypothetical protein
VDDLWIQWRHGNGGWVRFDASDWEGPVYVRFTEDEGRLVVRELYIDPRGGSLRSADLRKLDLSRLAALAGTDWNDPVHAANRREPGPDLRRLASHFNGLYRRGSDWITQSYLAQDPDSGVKAPKMGADVFPRMLEDVPPTAPLRAPEYGLTDDFLREVADAYASAVARHEHPAKTLARQTGFDARTVHSWVYKARKRGIMQPTKRGSVS